MKTLLFALRFAPFAVLTGIVSLIGGGMILHTYQPPPADLPFGPPVDYLKAAYLMLAVGGAALLYAVRQARKWMA